MNLKELTKLAKEYENKIREHGEEALKNEFKAFFENNPKVVKVAWQQGTPGFNDGDPCVFSVDDMVYLEEGEDEEDPLWDWPYLSGVDRELATLLHQNERLLEMTFGQAEIYVSREGIRAEECYDYGC